MYSFSELQSQQYYPNGFEFGEPLHVIHKAIDQMKRTTCTFIFSTCIHVWIRHAYFLLLLRQTSYQVTFNDPSAQLLPLVLSADVSDEETEGLTGSVLHWKDTLRRKNY